MSQDREPTRLGVPLNELLRRPTPRRRFSETLGAIGLLAGIAATFGAIALEAEKGLEDLTGEPIDGELKRLVTDMYGDNPPILRRKPSLNDNVMLGTVEVGIPVNVREVYGAIYPTDQPADFQIEAKGRVYGVWYQTIEPVRVQSEDGSQLRTGFLAGNFLRNPTEEELQIQQ